MARPAGVFVEGLGGAQFCIYSVESPGGYWLLGRTPLRLYDPQAEEPTLLRQAALLATCGIVTLVRVQGLAVLPTTDA